MTNARLRSDLPWLTVPLNMGDLFVDRSGLGDELNLRSGEQEHLQSKVIQTSSRSAMLPTIPALKVGSVAQAGVALAPGEIAGPLAGFLMIAIAAIAVLVRTLRAVQQPMNGAGK